MIANFFQSLSDHHVEHLLISGQATVLYGAATFSEDIDLWINPTTENISSLLMSLRVQNARYYKLTPPLNVENMEKGHGFHFTFGGEGAEVYLDVLGCPPRSRPFADAVAAAQTMETDWGNIRTIGLKDLVEVKKTQRLEDYPVISRLALAWLERPECPGLTDDYCWAAENIFTLDALRILFEQLSPPLDALPDHVPNLKEFYRQLLDKGEASENLEREVISAMQQRMNVLQEADRHYWRPIIAELKQWRACGALTREGEKV